MDKPAKPRPPSDGMTLFLFDPDARPEEILATLMDGLTKDEVAKVSADMTKEKPVPR